MTESDLPFLLSLFCSFRVKEMATAPWPQARKDAFLADQFRLQHRHFTTRFPNADFWIVERRGKSIGRLYLDRASSPWRVIDIGLLLEARGQGWGAGLLTWIQSRAVAAAADGIDLHVDIANARARTLYERLGFAAEGAVEGFRQRMVWPG